MLEVGIIEGWVGLENMIVENQSSMVDVLG